MREKFMKMPPVVGMAGIVMAIGASHEDYRLSQ
jgi:hypothetical protein